MILDDLAPSTNFLTSLAHGKAYFEMIPLIEKGMSQISELGEVRGNRKEWHHPSYIASNPCVRAIYLNRVYSLRESVSCNLQRIFDNGTYVHTRIQKYLMYHLYGSWGCKKCFKVIGENSLLKSIPDLQDILRDENIISYSHIPISLPEHCPECSGNHFKYLEWRVIDKDLEILGRIDGIIRRGEGVFHGVEIKSANSRSFASMSYTAPIVKKYVEQFTLYLSTLGLKTGSIIVENKDTQELREFFVEVDSKIVAELRKKLVDVNTYLKNGTEPKPVKSNLCYNCKYHGEYCKP